MAFIRSKMSLTMSKLAGVILIPCLAVRRCGVRTRWAQDRFEIYDYRKMSVHRRENFYDASFVSELDKSGYIDGLYKR
jgi:hypothetical protein